MLSNVLIIGPSGVALFAKDLVNEMSQPRLMGSLCTAMIEFSAKSTGLPVSYIELSKVAVSIVTDQMSRVTCVVFQDAADGEDFGHLVCTQILTSFLHEFRNNDFKQTHNLKIYQSFAVKLADSIEKSIHPIIARLQNCNGVDQVILVVDDNLAASTSAVDELGVVANLPALLTFAQDILAYAEDMTREIVLNGRDRRIHVLSIKQNTTLVVSCSKAIAAAACLPAIKEAASLLERLFGLVANLSTHT